MQIFYCWISALTRRKPTYFLGFISSDFSKTFLHFEKEILACNLFENVRGIFWKISRVIIEYLFYRTGFETVITMRVRNLSEQDIINWEQSTH